MCWYGYKEQVTNALSVQEDHIVRGHHAPFEIIVQGTEGRQLNKQGEKQFCPFQLMLRKQLCSTFLV